MKGAIFFAPKYASAREYARWIAEATGLPAHDIAACNAVPADYEFLVLGCPVVCHKLMFTKWVGRHQDVISGKPVVLFTVSGAPAGKKPDGWIVDSLPQDMIRRMHHVALRGQKDPKALTWFDRIMLIIGGRNYPDRQAGREELHGFDFMDVDSIQPVVAHIKTLKKADTTPASRSAVIASNPDHLERWKPMAWADRVKSRCPWMRPNALPLKQRPYQSAQFGHRVVDGWPGEPRAVSWWRAGACKG